MSLLAGLVACAAAPEALDLEAWTDPDVPTLVHVRWKTEAPERSRVRWSAGGRTGATAFTQTPSTAHAVRFLGAPAGGRVDIHVEAIDAEETTTERGDVSWFLDAPPDDVPTVEVVGTPPAPATPWVMLLVASVDPYGGLNGRVVVTDWEGRLVWWSPSYVVNFPFAHPRPDGTGLTLGYRYGDAENREAEVLQLAWDGGQESWWSPAAHHDVGLREDGRLLACRWEDRNVGGTLWSGETLSIVGPEGVERDVWSSFAREPDPAFCNDGLPTTRGSLDWGHCNGVAYDPSTDTALVSLLCQHSVVAIDVATGAERWALGGVLGNLQVPETAIFGPQHAPRFLPGNGEGSTGVRLFDNHPGSGGNSRLLDFDVDPTTGTAVVRKEWEVGSYVGVLGAGEAYGDSLLISDSGRGRVSLRAPDQELLAELQVSGATFVIAAEGVERFELP